jgi:hypothetical protein
MLVFLPNLCAWNVHRIYLQVWRNVLVNVRMLVVIILARILKSRVHKAPWLCSKYTSRHVFRTQPMSERQQNSPRLPCPFTQTIQCSVAVCVVWERKLCLWLVFVDYST